MPNWKFAQMELRHSLWWWSKKLPIAVFFCQLFSDVMKDNKYESNMNMCQEACWFTSPDLEQIVINGYVALSQTHSSPWARQLSVQTSGKHTRTHARTHTCTRTHTHARRHTRVVCVKSGSGCRSGFKAPANSIWVKSSHLITIDQSGLCIPGRTMSSQYCGQTWEVAANYK